MRRLAILATLLPLAALAHGDAAWIMQEPHFKDRAGLHCCGPADCSAVPAGTVVRVIDGWRVVATGRVFRDGDPDLYDSIDHRIWLCHRSAHDRCLFVPVSGV